MDDITNFPYGTLASGIDASTTSATLTTGHGARFPTAPFWAVIFNATDFTNAHLAYYAGEAEIVRVTVRSTDALTITRGQQGTSGVTHNTGGKTYVVMQTVDADLLESQIVARSLFTTRGDLAVRGASDWERLAIGPIGASLYSDRTDAYWYAPRNSWYMEDDFLYFTGAGTTFGSFSTGGSGGTNAGIAAEATAPGIISLSTSTSATGVRVMSQHATQILLGGGLYACGWRVRLNDLSTLTEEFIARAGLNDSLVATLGVDAIGFEYDRLTRTNWSILTSSNSSVTRQDSGVAVVEDAFIWLEIVVNAAASSVSFYINGVETSNSPISTNIPSGAGRQTGLAASIGKSAGTTARTLELDKAYMFQRYTSAHY